MQFLWEGFIRILDIGKAGRNEWYDFFDTWFAKVSI